jgi:ribosome biogenesis GTPase A
MAIQWYPGHMHKARKQVKQLMPEIDLIIEVLDARIPFSSENPLVQSFQQAKPCIKLLNKSDLADPNLTEHWIAFLQQSKGVTAHAVNCHDKTRIKKLPGMCRQALQHRNVADKPARILILGIPNVGKSTILNILTGRTVAKVGDEPAVTKRQQKIQFGHNMELTDTPGMLWPKIENENSGYRLAITGAIKNTAMGFEDVALFAAEYMLQAYSEGLKKRYKLKTLPTTGYELLQAIGAKRGCLRPGGVIDLHKASEIFLIEIRQNTLGPLTFETPEMIQSELTEEERASQ